MQIKHFSVQEREKGTTLEELSKWTFCNDADVLSLHCPVEWPLATCDEGPDFYILISLNLNSLMGLLATMWDSVALEQHSNFWPPVVWLYLALIQHQDLTLSFVKKGFSNFRFKAYLNWVGELKLQCFFFLKCRKISFPLMNARTCGSLTREMLHGQMNCLKTAPFSSKELWKK